MDGSVLQTWMSDILHVITQGLLVPDIVLLIAFIAYALFCIGSVVAEYFTERRHFKVTMPKFLAALMSAKENEIPEVIEQSGLLKRQKIALLTVYDYRMLPGDALIALIKRLVNEEEGRYDRISGRNNMAARVSPMLGLMGTLIPLGPGIQALGTANTELLSASLLIAFDTTVAGLVVAAICMVIGKIRSIWYGNYMSALDSGMATMLQKIEDMRAEGKIVTKEPTDYAFLFEQSIANKGEAKAEKDKPVAKSDGKSAKPSIQPGAKPAVKQDAKPAATPVSQSSPEAKGATADTSAAPASRPFQKQEHPVRKESASSYGQDATMPSGMPLLSPDSKYAYPSAGSKNTSSYQGASDGGNAANAAVSPTAASGTSSASSIDFSTLPVTTYSGEPVSGSPAPTSDAPSYSASAYDAGTPSANVGAGTGLGAGADAAVADTVAAAGANIGTYADAVIGDSAAASAPAATGFGMAADTGVAVDAGVTAGPSTVADFASTAPSFAYEPFQPVQPTTSFAPVPDPAFISDLAAAAAADAGAVPASAPAQEPAPSTVPLYDLPAEPAQSRGSGWYQPRLRSDSEPGQPYTPANTYSQQEQYPYHGAGADKGTQQ